MNEQRSANHVQASGGTWLWWLGHVAHHFATGAETDGRYMLAWENFPPGAGAPPHSHVFDEAFFVLNGAMTFIAGNQTLTLGAGGFVHIPGGVGHYMQNRGVENCEMLIFAMPSGFELFQREAGQAISGPDVQLGPPTPDDFARLMGAAPKYGIEMHPDPALFEAAPRITVRSAGEGKRIGMAGDVYRILASGEDTAGKFALFDTVVPPGGGPPPHLHHREEEGFYVLEGRLSFHADGKSFDVGPGECVTLPVGSLHYFRNEGHLPARMLIIVAPAGLEKMFEEAGTILEAHETQAPAVTPGEVEKMIAAAGKYGIEVVV